MKYPAGHLNVYEALYALNRDIEQVLVHFERLREQDDWTHVSQIYKDTLIEAKRFLVKKRREAAGKKGQRKRRRDKSEDV